MATLGLNHYNLRADHALMEKLRDFYCDIVGLVVGFRPPFGSHGYWLYAGEQAVLHLSEAAAAKLPQPGRGAAATPPITPRRPRLPPQQSHHHTRATPPSPRSITPHSAARVWQSFESRLTQQAIQYRVASVPQTGQVQIFLRDPAGNGVELNFATG